MGAYAVHAPRYEYSRIVRGATFLASLGVSQRASVYEDGLAGYEVAGVGGEIDDERGEVVGVSLSA